MLQSVIVSTEPEVLSVETIKTRAISGVLALTGRTSFLQLVGLPATFLLSIFLDPGAFGTFGVVSALLGFVAYFSNVGIAAALIQKKENPSRKELVSTFTVQQTLVLLIIIAIFTATPWIKSWQHLTAEGVYLLWAMIGSLLFSSLKTIPAILLERELRFEKLIIPEILEQLAFSLVVVFFAWKGFGVTSYTYGVLVRGVIGLVAMYLVRPWTPGVGFDKKSLKGLLGFGVPYQLNGFLALIKDEGILIFLGAAITPVGVGFYRWAKTWGEAPLRSFMDPVIKVTFPAYARLQNDMANLSSALSRSIFFICLLVFPVTTGLVLLAPMLTEIIPRYEKWQPGLFTLTLFGISAGIGAVTTPLTNLLSAIGKIKTTFKLMVMWTILTWLTIPYFAIQKGLDGVAIGVFLVSLSSIVAIVAAYRQVPFDWIYAIGKPLVASTVMGVTIFLLKNGLPHNTLTVITLVGAGACVYASAIIALVGSTVLQDGRKVFNAIFKK